MSTTMHSPTAASTLLVFLLFASTLAAADVTPATGTHGTLLSITLDDALPSPPTVFLRPELGGKAKKLKVLGHTGKAVQAEIPAALKLPAGRYDLVVDPAGKAEAVSEPAAFEVVLPHDLLLDPAVAEPGSTLSLWGSALGTKRGKIKVGGKKAFIKSWPTAAGQPVVLRLPKKLGNGLQDLVVTVGAGSATLPDALEIVGGGPDPDPSPPGKTQLRLEANGKVRKAKDPSLLLNVLHPPGEPPVTWGMLFAAGSAGPGRSWGVEVFFSGEGDPAAGTVTCTGTEVVMAYLILDLFNPFGNKTWVNEGSQASLTLRQHENGMVTGEFDGVLAPAVNDNETMEITHGSFAAKPEAEDP